MIVLIFDIDGVLIDDQSSYYEAVGKTVSVCISHFFKHSFDPAIIDHHSIHQLKRKGGFNNDFDVTAAFLCYYVSLFDRGLKQEKSWNFLSFIEKCSNSGLDSILKATGEKNTDKLRFFLDNKNCPKAYPDNSLVRIFQEIYLGELLFKKHYGEEPFFCRERGSIHNEERLVYSGCLKRLYSYCDAFAIATGRERGEAEFSLREHFREFFFEYIVTASCLPPSKQKPHPESLFKIDQYFSSKEKNCSYFFVGDQMDDMIMGFAAQKKINLTPIAFVRKQGSFSVDELKKKGVKYIISDHSEIENILIKKS